MYTNSDMKELCKMVVHGREMYNGEDIMEEIVYSCPYFFKEQTGSMYYDGCSMLSAPTCSCGKNKCKWFKRDNPEQEICELTVDYSVNPDFDWNEYAISKEEKTGMGTVGEQSKCEKTLTYKDVSECAKSIIRGMRNVSKYGIIIEDNEIINEGTPDEYKEIKISVPKKSFIKVDDVEMSGMELAKWYKDNLSEFVKLAIMISDITSGNNLLEDSGLPEEEIRELLSGLYRVKAKVRDDEWTKELSDACLKAFDEEIQEIIEKVKKEEEEYIEV